MFPGNSALGLAGNIITHHAAEVVGVLDSFMQKFCGERRQSQTTRCVYAEKSPVMAEAVEATMGLWCKLMD